MAYRVPLVPPGVAEDPEAQAAYLLEDGFNAAPEDALVDKLRRGEPLRVKFDVDLADRVHVPPVAGTGLGGDQGRCGAGWHGV